MNPITRRLILAGAGMGAAALGTSLAWRKLNNSPSPAAQAFWSQLFPGPNGGQLDVARLRGQPLLVNFWATWCPPCVKELPEINQFYLEAKSKGWAWCASSATRPADCPFPSSSTKLARSAGGDWASAGLKSCASWPKIRHLRCKAA
jgi:hypothetical protein